MLRPRFTFRGQRFDIPDEIEQHYLQNILQREVQNKQSGNNSCCRANRATCSPSDHLATKGGRGDAEPVSRN